MASWSRRLSRVPLPPWRTGKLTRMPRAGATPPKIDSRRLFAMVEDDDEEGRGPRRRGRHPKPGLELANASRPRTSRGSSMSRCRTRPMTRPRWAVSSNRTAGAHQRQGALARSPLGGDLVSHGRRPGLCRRDDHAPRHASLPNKRKESAPPLVRGQQPVTKNAGYAGYAGFPSRFYAAPP